MIDIEGKEWTRQTYEKIRSGEMVEYLVRNNPAMFDDLFSRIRKLLDGQSSDPDRFVIVLNRIDRTIERLEKEFPTIPKRKPKK